MSDPKTTRINPSVQEKKTIKCRNCYQWKRDGFCTVYQKIIKAPDTEHLCLYFDENTPEKKIAQEKKALKLFNRLQREAKNESI